MYDSRSKTNERRIEIKGNGIMKGATKIATASLAFVVTFCAVQGDAKELAKSAPPDDCLAAPNSPAPDGSQWRYRLERGTQRKCWYVRASDKATRKAAPPERPGVATALHSTPAQVPLKPAADVASKPASTTNIQRSVAHTITSQTGDPLAPPAAMSSERGTQAAVPVPQTEADKTSSIQSATVPSEPNAEESASPANASTVNSAGNAYLTSMQGASGAPTSSASGTSAEESALRLNTARVSSAASRDTIPDPSAAQAGTPLESNAQQLEVMPRISPRFSDSSDTDTQVAEPVRKAERADGPRIVGMLNEATSARPATLPSGSQSGPNGGEINLQTLIVVALTAAAGLAVAGMLLRVVLLDRAARRESIARVDAETDAEAMRRDPYNDPEFYRRLREGNIAPAVT
jgi:hypothetical protein